MQMKELHNTKKLKTFGL